MDSLDDLNGMTTFELTDAKKWEEHPAILQEKYSLLDALVVGGLGITILNNVDSVEISCLAQLLNVISPITTDEDGHLLKQTIYYPFELLTQYGRGEVLKPHVESDTQHTDYGDVPVVETATVYNKDHQQLHIFALNTDTENDATLVIHLNGFNSVKLTGHTTLTGDDLKAINTFDKPNNVTPTALSINNESLNNLNLPKASWNVLTVDVTK